MRKPKIKKRKNYWIVYKHREQIFKCFSLETAHFYYNVLLSV